MLAQLVDLVLPRRCVGCAAPAAGLCARCIAAAQPVEVACASVRVCAGAAYDGAVRAAILRYKERGRRDLAAPLSVLLARAVGRVLAGKTEGAVLVGVPSSRAAAAARGGDHVARLIRLAAVRAGVPSAPAVLRQVRGKQDSAGLDVRARAENLAGVFASLPAPAGLAAVLVDDIVTTGATVREATRTLARAGWPVLGAAVIAATPLRGARGRAVHGSGVAMPLAGQRHPG